MKTFGPTLIGVAVLALAAATVSAQSDTNAPSPKTFFQSAEGYLTSFNTNYTWSGVRLEFAVGADYQNGVQWANDLEIAWDVSTNNGVQLGCRMRNAGIAGVVQSDEAKIGYNLVSFYDTRVEGGLYAGYDNQYSCAIIEPEIDLRKKLTPNTFAGIYLSEPIRLKRSGVPNPWEPNVGLETGFTF